MSVSNTPDFIPGLELSRIFYTEAVRPVIDLHYPGLAYSAARIGYGSEVLGFDTPLSRDHDWGPRLTLFLRPEDHARLYSEIDQALRRGLPNQIRGYSTHWTDPRADGTLTLQEIEHGPVHHRVEIRTLNEFVRDYLGTDLDQPLDPADWLTFPQQKLLGLTGGAVYQDAVGLEDVRGRFRWYPQDVWLYQMAAGWARIGQEEHLVGRAGEAGDEIGSRLIGARLVRDLMRLGFLMEKRYAPYPKWLGSAFATLHCAAELGPALRQATAAAAWQDRLEALADAYEIAARLHNALGVTPPIPAQRDRFYNRPFWVIWGEHFANALREQITGPAVAAIAARPLIGAIDQWSDNTDLLENPTFRRAARELYL